jgi:hypothetical protein
MSIRRIAFSLGALALCVCVIAGIAFMFYPDGSGLDKRAPGPITLRSTVADSEPTTDSEAPFATKTLPDVVTYNANDPVGSTNHAEEPSAPNTPVGSANHTEESSTPGTPVRSANHTAESSAPGTPVDSTNHTAEASAPGTRVGSTNHAAEPSAPGTPMDSTNDTAEPSAPNAPVRSANQTDEPTAPNTPVGSINHADAPAAPSTQGGPVTPATDAPKAASVNIDDIVHGDASEATIAAPATTASIAPKINPASDRSIEECAAIDACVDDYLWVLYQRAPKEDAVKVVQKRSVTVQVEGKTKTVTKEFTTVVDEDFTWKDPKAAEHAGMSLKDYVIGGMDRDFRVKLYRGLRAMDDAGLMPGITSAFRDDYRQSLASGLKAAIDRSYHGGSFRGGYGHGLAADLVSVKGETRTERLASSEKLWAWIDAHSKELEIGRPYLSKDPPHVGPLDGKEYADHRGSTIARLARLGLKKLKAVVARSSQPPHQ